MARITIPQFLLPRGARSPRTLQTLSRKPISASTSKRNTIRRFSTTPPTQKTSSANNNNDKHRILEKPDKFRPPSHPQRRVLQPRSSSLGQNYPGPRMTEKEKEEQKKKAYPNMFPPEGTFMHRFLSSRGLHAWIALVALPSSLQGDNSSRQMTTRYANISQERINNPSNIHLHQQLQVHLPLRTPPTFLVQSIYLAVRDNLSGAVCLPHGRAA